MLKSSAVCGYILLVLCGCGQMTPPAALLSGQIDVIEIGTPEPEYEEYVLHIPANKDFPVRFFIHGSLFNEEVDYTRKVSFKKDVYLYKEWSSFDGKTWLNPEKFDEQLHFMITTDLTSVGGFVEIYADEK